MGGLIYLSPMSPSAALSLTPVPVRQKVPDVKSSLESISEALRPLATQANLDKGAAGLDKASSFKDLLDGLGQGLEVNTKIVDANDPKAISNPSDGLIAAQFLPEVTQKLVPEFPIENASSSTDIGLVLKPKTDILPQTPFLVSGSDKALGDKPLLVKRPDQISPLLITRGLSDAKSDEALRGRAPADSEVSRETKTVTKPKLNVPNLLEAKTAATSPKEDTSDDTNITPLVP
jgi:hypothetical protein